MSHLSTILQPNPNGLWSKDKNFGRTQAVSILLHAGIIALLLTPLIKQITTTPAVGTAPHHSSLLSIPADLASLLMSEQQGGHGGGGGGDRSVLPPTTGAPPKFGWRQLSPPEPPKNSHPILAVVPTLVGPDLEIPRKNIGDPFTNTVTNAGGPGNKGGLGNGSNGGIGDNNGPGLGLGDDGGFGGVGEPGKYGVSTPVCFFQPSPEYSEEARKLKYQGSVMVEGIVGIDGRITHVRVIKGVGMGLDQNAVTTVQTWRCKPAVGPDRKAVATRVPIEVIYRLY